MSNSKHSPEYLKEYFALATVFGSFVVALSFAITSAAWTFDAVAAHAGQNHDDVLSFNEAGELIRPTGYREWIYLGTPVTPNDMNNGKAPFPEFHNVYMPQSAFEAYSTTGEYPEGTVLVKELVSVGTKKATSGKGYFMGEFIGLEVAIKSAARFPDEPGNWAYFSFGHSYPLAEKAAPQPTIVCNTCHDASADEDWVFSQYYPVLRASKP